jgi:hypothetical protein
MSGPAAPNWAGNTQFIGPTGPAGQNGAAGGLTLFLDSATSTSVPTTGSLLLAPVLTAQTTIAYAASNSTVLIAKFPSAVGAIVEETITPGYWDMNIYASSSSLTNAPLFYWSLYRVDSDGSSNPLLIADGAANEQVITSLTAALQTQSLLIPPVLLPAGKRIACYLYARYRSGSRTATFSFRTGSQSFIGTTIVDSAQNWSEYPAHADLQIAGYNISNVGTINATTANVGTLNSTTISNAGTITTNSLASCNVYSTLYGNVVGNISNTNLTVLGQFSITETADVGDSLCNYASYGTVNISGKGGLGGIVNITADVATPLNPAFTVSQLTMEAKGNYGNFFISPPDPYLGYFPRGGLVSIIAQAGLSPTPPATVTSALLGNGEIDLTAYSYGTVPGLIKLSAGANSMYAGTFSPVTGVYGNNYIFGQYGNSMTAGLPAGGLPVYVGTNYLYGYNGTIVENGLYTDTIYNKYGVSLNWNSASNTSFLVSSNLNMNAGAVNITTPVLSMISGYINMCNHAISNAPSISSSAGLALTATSNISLNAGTSIQMTTNGFSNITMNTNVLNLNGNLNMSNHNIDQVTFLQCVAGGGSLCNVSNIIGPSSVFEGSNMTIINQQNTLSIASYNASNGALDIIAGSNYHRIQMPQAGQGMAITSSNSITIANGSNINNFTQATGTDLVSSNYMNIYGSAVTISNGASTNKLSLGYGSAGAQLISSNYLRLSNTYNNFLLDSDAKLSATGLITISNAASSIKMTSVGQVSISNASSSIVLPVATTLVATGGTITVSGGRKFHTFTSSGTFAVVSGAGATIEVMAIGGGGGGGVQSGGGGGAGNMVIATGALSVGSYAVVVGAGGVGGVVSASQGGDGETTTFNGSGTLNALGGGGGGTYGIGAGRNGGCGGGGSELGERQHGGANTGNIHSPLTQVTNLAENGGEGTNGGSQGGAGGGGTSAQGVNHVANTSAGSAGGAGTLYYGTYYGGGGGGGQGGTYWGTPYNGGAGGLGGGGNGSGFGVGGTPLTRGTAGTPNTGGGGGGASANTGDTTGLAGGSGIVIVSYDYSPGEVALTSTTDVNITTPTTNVSGDLNVGGALALSGDINMATHNISNAGTVGTNYLNTNYVNGAIATPITNDGTLIFKNYIVSAFSGSLTFQVTGNTYDGTSIKVGNLPAGIYNFLSVCTNNSKRSMSSIMIITPAQTVQVAQGNVLDSTDSVQMYPNNLNISGVIYGTVIFNNTTVGGGDNFYLYIHMISSTWDGTNSWDIY